MKKRIIAVLSLILAIIIGIGGCGFTPDNKTSSADSSNITIDNESNNASTVSSNNESNTSESDSSASSNNKSSSTESKKETSSHNNVSSKKPSVEESSVTNSSLEDLSNESSSVEVSSPESSSIEDSTDTQSTPSGNSGKIKYVAFTFDDGPSSTYTKKIVDKLASYNGRATFFVVGNLLNSKNGAAIQYAVQKGNEIGIHAYTHSYSYSKCSESTYKSELSKTADAIHKYLPNYNITLMRPVGGSISSSRAAACPYAVIKWNVDSNDWRYKKPAGSSDKINTIYNNTVKNVKNGDIILMHEIYKNSYEAFCKAADKLYNDGFRFVTVTELIGKSNIKPGKIYSRG